MHTDFRSSHLESPTVERPLWRSFLVKIVYPRTAFLYYTSRYVSVCVKQKKTAKLFQNIVLFNQCVAASKTSKSFEIPDASL